MADLSIRRLIERVTSGEIRIPSFQRGFVWNAERVAYLMDSIYKGYPFGAVILWHTKQVLTAERRLGPFELPKSKVDFPVDYVLDGQQRLTSIFGVFQTDLVADGDDSWTHIYFDMSAPVDFQESQFVALSPDEADIARYFPINTFFDVTGYRAATESLDAEQAKAIDSVQAAFKEASIPTQEIITDDRAKVAIVFERVNRLGVDLDVFQLLTAWTWSENFDLQTKFEELAEELRPFGFGEVGEDSNLLLRCCAGIVAGDVSPEALISLNGQDVRDRFDEVENGIRGAIDFLRKNIRVERLANLPYPTLIVPLAVFFSRPPKTVSADQRDSLLRWFWRSCFSRRFSAAVLRNLNRDIEEAAALRDGTRTSLADIATNLSKEYFSENTFNISTVNTRAFVLLLTQQQPLSFISGSNVTLSGVLQRYNRNEFHHLMPRAFLKDRGFDAADINRLTNFAIISSAENNALSGAAPSEYRAKMPAAKIPLILSRSLVPESLFDDDYEEFTDHRAELLLKAAQVLIGPRG
ncbi:GmrSD restriction endonuclease domain-containing protein [Mycobacterium colombiense]